MNAIARGSGEDRRKTNSISMKRFDNHWISVFEKYDRDKDGQIPIQDFIEQLKNESNDVPPRVIAELDALFKDSDRNADNKISLQEFLRMIHSKKSTTARKLFQNYINSTIPRRTRMRDDHTDGEYEEEYSCNPPALCMILVSLLEISMFAYDYSSGYKSINGPTASLFIYDPYRRKEAWRFLTYMFVHVGVFHLGVNLVVQILLGIPLEMVHGWWRVLIVYLSGVAAGSLGTSISDPGVFLAGASGGVYALITAHIATIIMNWSEMQYAVWQFAIFLALTVVDLGSAIYSRYTLDVSQIGYVAHLGGAVAGLLVGIYILRNLQKTPWEKKIWWAALLIYVILMGIGIIINVAVPSYFPPQKV